MFTRTTDARGRVLSGVPIRVDTIVPRRWDDTDAVWTSRALTAALR